MTPSIGTNQLRRHPLAEFENPAYLRGTAPFSAATPRALAGRLNQSLRTSSYAPHVGGCPRRSSDFQMTSGEWPILALSLEIFWKD
jgi:hypothetical protein